VDYETWNEYEKISIVRNPFDWIVSNYNWITNNKWHSDHGIAINKTFKEFVQWIRDVGFKKDIYSSTIVKIDSFYTNQHEFVCDKDGSLIVDKVFKMEKLNSDFQEWKKNFPTITIEKMPHINITPHDDYKKYYDKETEKMVVDMYQKDFDMFGYSTTLN